MVLAEYSATRLSRKITAAVTLVTDVPTAFVRSGIAAINAIMIPAACVIALPGSLIDTDMLISPFTDPASSPCRQVL